VRRDNVRLDCCRRVLEVALSLPGTVKCRWMSSSQYQRCPKEGRRIQHTFGFEAEPQNRFDGTSHSVSIEWHNSTLVRKPASRDEMLAPKLLLLVEEPKHIIGDDLAPC
jgi:hypothetical protein